MTSLTERITVSLGTATPGGGFPVYGQAFTDTVNEIEPALEVTPQNTKGSTENIPLLEAGKIDLGHRCLDRVFEFLFTGTNHDMLRADGEYARLVEWRQMVLLHRHSQ